MGAARFGLCIVMVAGVAAAEEKKPATFEEALAGAEPAGDLAQRFDPLFADCKRDDDLDARQCAAVRDAMLEKLREGTYVALGDDSSLTWTPWTAQEKQIGLEVHGCLACGKPLVIAGQPRFVTTRVPKAIKAGKAVGLDTGFYGVTLATQPQAARWVKETLPRLRVEYVFKAGPVWKSGDKFEGVTFVPVAQRVFDHCSGKVYASEPPSSQPAEPIVDATCPAVAPKETDESLPDQLSREQVVRAMRGVESKVHDCFVEFQAAGTVTVRIVAEGDGKLQSIAILPPFDKTPTGYCARSAISGVSLPHFRGEKMTITYPFMLR